MPKHSVCKFKTSNFILQIRFIQEQMPFIEITITSQSKNNQNYIIKIKHQQLQTHFDNKFDKLEELYSYLCLAETQSQILSVSDEGKVQIKITSESTEKTIKLQRNLGKSEIISSKLGAQENNNSEGSEKEATKQQISQQKHYQASSCITGNESPSQIQTFSREQHLCFHAILMLKQGATVVDLMHNLNISQAAARKLSFQFRTKKKIILPKGTRPQLQEQHQTNYQFQFHIHQEHDKYLNTHKQNGTSPILQGNQASNNESVGKQSGTGSRLPNQTAQKIRKILLQVVKEGKVRSYQEMQQYLSSLKIQRSMSAIYRHVSIIKSNHSELKNRLFAIRKKDARQYQALEDYDASLK